MWSMRPESAGPAFFTPPAHGQAIDYAIELRIGGTAIAAARARRVRALPGVTVRPITAPFVGTLALPPLAGKHPAIILLGGSEGGDSMSDVAPLLASHGFVTVSVAYFGLPGLPKYLVDIPVETVGAAIGWISKQPYVDARRISVLGISRGGDLAFLVGATYPQIHSVVSVVGAPFAMYGIDLGAPNRNAAGAWSLAGKELPFVPADPGGAAKVHRLIADGGKVALGIEADASVTNNPEAVARAFFPLQNIRGRVLCVGGGDDQLMNSARSCDMALQYLREHNHPYDDRKLVFPTAGHDVLSFFLPTFGYREFAVGRFTEVDGGSPQADGTANETAWPAILEFLETAGIGNERVPSASPP